MEHIKSTLDILNTRPHADQGQSGRPAGSRGQIFISCKDSYQDEGSSKCEMGSFGGTQSHESVNVASKIEICPAFFHQPRFDLLKSAAAGRRSTREYQLILSEMFKDPDHGECDKDYEGSDGKSTPWDHGWTFMLTVVLYLNVAGVLLHEMSHVWWLGATNAPSFQNNQWTVPVPEEYGYVNCADLAWNNQHDTKLFVKNADTYMWYAEYGYWLTHYRDTWPEMDKPAKLPKS